MFCHCWFWGIMHQFFHSIFDVNMWECALGSALTVSWNFLKHSKHCIQVEKQISWVEKYKFVQKSKNLQNSILHHFGVEPTKHGSNIYRIIVFLKVLIYPVLLRCYPNMTNIVCSRWALSGETHRWQQTVSGLLLERLSFIYCKLLFHMNHKLQYLFLSIPFLTSHLHF